MEAEGARREPTAEERRRTVDEAADAVPDRLLVEGARLAYRQNCESMQRVHISPAIGKRRQAGLGVGEPGHGRSAPPPASRRGR